jgi:hypothetical protein
LDGPQSSGAADQESSLKQVSLTARCENTKLNLNEPPSTTRSRLRNIEVSLLFLLRPEARNLLALLASCASNQQQKATVYEVNQRRNIWGPSTNTRGQPLLGSDNNKKYFEGGGGSANKKEK